MEILGPLGQIQTGEWAPLAGEIDRLYRRSFANHAGGTSQVKRMVVATRGTRTPEIAEARDMAIDLTLDDDQLLLQQSAHEFFRRRYPSEFVRTLEAGDVGYSPEHWREMADLGWLGITIPAELGGGGGRYLDLYPIYEEMGRFLVPSPHLDAVAVAADVVLSAGTDAQRASLLPKVAAGDLVVIPAVLERDGALASDAIAGSASRRGDDFVVNATKLLVPFAVLGRLLPRPGSHRGARRHLVVPRRRARRRSLVRPAPQHRRSCAVGGALRRRVHAEREPRRCRR